MNKELHQRIKEAADKCCLENGLIAGACASQISYGYSCMRDGFIAGAEFGYKEAIAFAKEWLKENTYNKIIKGDLPDDIEEPDCYTLYSTQQQLLVDFEADMNKLWEE